MGQKLKTAFRGGQFVSNLKANVASSVGGGDALKVHYVNTFTGHRDGVWDIDALCEPGRSWLASASMGMLFGSWFGRAWLVATVDDEECSFSRRTLTISYINRRL